MIGEMFASDEQIVAITQDVWSSFTGTAIGSASEEVALDTGEGNDSVRSGAGNDRLWGHEGDDVLLAEAGHDRLSGGEGNDVLNGGLGNDVMAGGEGADRFVFNGGTDRIIDFENDDDEIDLSFFAQFTGFASIRAAASQSGTDVIIRAGGNALVIEDTRLSQLDGDDFIW